MNELHRRWRDVYESQQRALFVRVWGEHIRRQLAALNAADPSRVRRLQDIAEVAPVRAAALLTAAWLEQPQQVLRKLEPAEAADDNRTVVSVALQLATATVVAAGTAHARAWTVVARQLDATMRELLRTNEDSGWDDALTRTYDLGRVDPVVRDAFTRLTAERGVITGPAGGTRGRRWLPSAVANWFAPTARMANRPTQERRHAVVDAYFHDEYRALAAPSPVRLLLTFPHSDLVAPPAPRRDAEAYERSCVLQDERWYVTFERSLDGLPEVSLVTAVLTSRPPLAQRYVSPPAAVPTPFIPPVAAVLVEWFDGLDLADGVMAEVLAVASTVLGAGGGDVERVAALDVVAWLSRRDETDLVAAICTSLDRVPPVARFGVIGRVQAVVVSELARREEGDTDD